jgi:hypothetical protein
MARGTKEVPMLNIFAWPAETEEPRPPIRRSPDRCRRFEEKLARSYAEMRARRRKHA